MRILRVNSWAGRPCYFFNLIYRAR